MEYLLNHCQAVLENHGGLVATLFLGGLLGSLTHCVGMCGPFAFAQTTASRFGRGGSGHTDTVFSRVRGAALLPYHLGRITTYSILGVTAAAFSGFFAGSNTFQTVAGVLMVLAGTLFLASAIPALNIPSMPALTQGAGQAIGRVARPFIAGHTGLHRYALGIALGFLPCGLVAAALLAVAATGEPFTAFFAMVGFGLATIPALIFAAALGQLSASRWPIKIKSIARGAMVLSGASLFAIAGGLLS